MVFDAMTDVRVVFGAKSPLIDHFLRSSGWSRYLLISSSASQIMDEKQNLLGNLSDLEQIVIDQLNGTSGRLLIIYSGPFSRLHSIDVNVGIDSLVDLYRLIDNLLAKTQKLTIDLVVLGSIETAVDGIYDQYRQLKKIELNFFLVKLMKQVSRLRMRYYALPTMRPSRLVGKLLCVNYQSVADRLANSIDRNDDGIGQYRDFRYILFNLLLKLKLNGTVKTFKW